MDWNNKDMIVYNSADGEISVDVKTDGETIWVSQSQMAELFQTDRTSILRHIKNIYQSDELEEKATCAKIAQVRKEGRREVERELTYYNLDVVISVGYRVNSKRGTQFRQWANRILKEYMINRYVIDRTLTSQKYNELSQAVRLLARTIEYPQLTADEGKELVHVVTDYSYALDTLDRYDYQQLTIGNTTSAQPFHATYENAMAAINDLKAKFGESRWFGNEKDQSFRSSIGQIYQTFDGVELYPSVEEKAAMLLYLVTKNHSFSDGNKRIAAMLFLWFLSGNGILYNPDGTKRIADNTLVALTLMIAESRTEEKDVIIKVVVNLINKDNYDA